jgi:DNA repair protein RecO
MSSLLTDNGLVLHTVRHGETSLIITVFGRETGKVGLIAKGARSKSKLGSVAALEIFSEAQFVFYHKPGRDLQLLKEWTILEPHRELRGDFVLLTMASAVAELLAKCLREHDAHRELYDSAAVVLSALDSKPVSPFPLLWQFELRLFRALGFELPFATCAATGKPLVPPFAAPVRFRLADGAFFGSEAVGIAADGELQGEAFAILSTLAAVTSRFASRLRIDLRVQQEITRFLARYLETHLPVTGKLRSLNALSWGKAAADETQ